MNLENKKEINDENLNEYLNNQKEVEKQSVEMWQKFKQTPFGRNSGELISRFKANLKTKAMIAGAIGIALIASGEKAPFSIDVNAHFSSIKNEQSKVDIPDNIQQDVQNIKIDIDKTHNAFVQGVEDKIKQYGVMNSAVYMHDIETANQETKYDKYSNTNAIQYNAENIYFASITNSSYVSLTQPSSVNWTSNTMQQKVYFLKESMAENDVETERMIVSAIGDDVNDAIMNALSEVVSIRYGENGAGTNNQKTVNNETSSDKIQTESETITLTSEGYIFRYNVKDIKAMDGADTFNVVVEVIVEKEGGEQGVDIASEDENGEWINPDEENMFDTTPGTTNSNDYKNNWVNPDT